MSDYPLHYLHLHELAERIASRAVSPVEVTEHLLERIGRLDPALKAYVTLMSASARAEAERAERELVAGEHRGPLHGVPLAMKDLLDTAGVRTMGGSAVFRARVPVRDATMVRRLRDAGAVILGKLNLTEGAMSAYHPQLDAPFNPWDRSMSPGGSSSGSGVATAAGLCFGSIGSDTGGSIRFPSALCGVTGLKPTWGRVSRAGVMHLAESLDHFGPMTRCVRDAVIMFMAMAGPDEDDVTTLPGPVPDLVGALDAGVRGLRIGWAEDYACNGIDPETAAAAREAVAVLERAGATVVEVTLPDLLPYIDAWSELCPAEAVAAHAGTYPDRAGEYGPWLRSWLDRGAALSGADYARLNQLRLACNATLRRAFTAIDVLVSPAMFGPEPRPDDADLFERPCAGSRGFRQRFTVPTNYNGAPTFTLPGGLNGNGFPLAVQFAGRPGEEVTITLAAAAYERATGHDRLHPSI